jgi:HSP20 family protein
MAIASSKRYSREWFKNEEDGKGSRSQSQQGSMGGMQQNFPSTYFGPLSSFFSNMDRMFDNTFRNFGLPALMSQTGLGGMQGMFRPNIDITSTRDEYAITAEVPGIEEKDIKLDVTADGQLIISGEKKFEREDRQGDVQYAEASYGSFERVLSLPDDVDRESVEARFKNGLLTITCPRTEASKMQTRHIPISARGGEMRGERGERGESARGAANTSTSNQGQRKAA